MLTEGGVCESDDPFGRGGLRQAAIDAGIDSDLAEKMGRIGTLVIGGDCVFKLQVPNKEIGSTAEFRFDGERVEISLIKDGQRNPSAQIDNTTLQNIKFTPAGDLIVKKPEWHSFDVFGITPQGSILINSRE